MTRLPNKLLGLASGVGAPGINLRSGYSVLPAGGQRLGEVSPERSFQRAHPLSSKCVSPLPVWMLGLDCSMKTPLMRSPLYILRPVEITGMSFLWEGTLPASAD